MRRGGAKISVKIFDCNHLCAGPALLVAGWRLTEMVCTSRCLPGENVVNCGEGEILPRRGSFFKTVAQDFDC